MHTTIPPELREVVAGHTPGTVLISPEGFPGRAIRCVSPRKLASCLMLSGLDAPETVETAEAHLDALRDSGVGVPGLDFYLLGNRVLVIVADQINGWHLHPHKRPNPIPLPQDTLDRYSAQARAGLETYRQIIAGQIHSPHQNAALGHFILGEITPEKQWMVGESVARPELGEQMFMVDPDPLLFPAGRAQLADFARRANDLRP